MNTEKTTEKNISGDEEINASDFEENTLDSGENAENDDQKFNDFNPEPSEQNKIDDFEKDDFDDIEDFEDEVSDEDNFDVDNDFHFDDDQEEESEEKEDEDDDLEFEEKEKEDEDDDNDEDIKDLNKRLGTDFNSIDEMKKALSKEEETESSQKEQDDYDRQVKTIGMFDKFLQYAPEDLIKEDRHLRAYQQGKDLNSEEVQEEIEDQVEQEIDSMKENGTFQLNVDHLRSKYIDAIKNIQEKTSVFENKIKESEQKTEAQKKEDLTSSISEIYNSKKDNFYGSKITKKEAKQAYRDIKSGKFISEVEKNSKDLVELYFMMKNRKNISKNSSNASVDDIKKSVLDQHSRRSNRQSLSKAKRGKTRKSTDNSNERLIMDFIK